MINPYLVRKLNSVGKKAFIENFVLFKEYANGSLTRTAAIKELVRRGVSNERGAAIRVGNAKLIFDNSLAHDALAITIKSNRLTRKVILEAERLRGL
jgi:hypothetical protein